MHKTLTLIFVLLATACLAQEQTIPTRRILPEDIAQDSIKSIRISTNSFRVTWIYTEAGAKKMLAFQRAHAGQDTVLQIGSFECRPNISPLGTKPTGWTEEGWLKRRTDKFFNVSEGDAQKIVEGLKNK